MGLRRWPPDPGVDDVHSSELAEHQTLIFSRLPSGLYPELSGGDSIATSGYGNVWVRDNVYVALAHHVSGDTHVAVDVVRALVTFFTRYRHRLDGFVLGELDPGDVSQRPHVRIDGTALGEIAGERWAHAQNDALGYFPWLSSRLAASGGLDPGPETVAVIADGSLLRRDPVLAGRRQRSLGGRAEAVSVQCRHGRGRTPSFLALTEDATVARWHRR